MPTYYVGKLSLSDFMPGLSSAAADLMEKNAEVEQFLSDRQKNVEGLSKRVTAIQDEFTRAQQVATESQQILDAANSALQEAKNLVGAVSSALDQAGIYHYNYVGQIGNMGSSLDGMVGSGLPDKLPGQPAAITSPELEAVAAVILIAGGDGTALNSVNRIAALAGQIGNNATDIVDLYKAEADIDESIEPDPELVVPDTNL